MIKNDLNDIDRKDEIAASTSSPRNDNSQRHDDGLDVVDMYDHGGEEVTRKKKKKIFSLVIIILFVFSNIVIGLVGGVAGFVLMSNSNSPLFKSIRTGLNLNDKSISIPVNQNITLQESSAIIDAAKKVSPAVVSIAASQQVTDWFGNTSTQQTSGGTGFILTSDGLIATNKHVVTAANGASMKVVLNDGRTFDATIQAQDTVNDFAVIKIEAKDLPTVEIGSSDSMLIGQSVLAIGNALGEFKNSITSGIISAKGRQLDATTSSQSSQSETLTDLIQTDAAINPGNSGGPLVNMAGQVIGINTAIASTSGGSVGIGFAIPIDSLKSVIDSVRKTGTIVRPYLGVRYIPVNATVKTQNNLTVDYGALVSRGANAGEVAVMPGSPADKAGIVENDIILELNGERIDDNNSLPKRISKYNVGDEVTLTVMRKGDTIKVKVKLEKMN